MKESTFICWSAISTSSPSQALPLHITCYPHTSSHPAARGDFESYQLESLHILPTAPRASADPILPQEGFESIQLEIWERAEKLVVLIIFLLYDAARPSLRLLPVAV